MKVKVFEFSKPYWSWGWRVEPSVIEDTLAAWFLDNPKSKIQYILHQNVGSGFWFPPQLVVTIYYI